MLFLLLLPIFNTSISQSQKLAIPVILHYEHCKAYPVPFLPSYLCKVFLFCLHIILCLVIFLYIKISVFSKCTLVFCSFLQAIQWELKLLLIWSSNTTLPFIQWFNFLPYDSQLLCVHYSRCYAMTSSFCLWVWAHKPAEEADI